MLDIDPDCGADVVHDLNVLPYPFEDGEFDEIHAYNILEHCGSQGDVEFFFAQFNELGRILRPGGMLAGVVPGLESPWLWGDPGHTRAITLDMLQFLDRSFYGDGRTQSEAYLKLLTCSWRIEWHEVLENKLLAFVLRRE